MAHHSAFGLDIEQLDVVIVEDSKPMQTVLRSILMPLRFDRTRVFDSADEALQAMLSEPPNLVISDWRMRPTSGYRLLRTMRQKQLVPLCNVPVVFVTAHATRSLIEKAVRGGAHHLLAKPLSPAKLHECIHWIVCDRRQFVADETGMVGIEGVVEAFDSKHKKIACLNRARAFHKQMEKRAVAAQSTVDTIIAGGRPADFASVPVEHDRIERTPGGLSQSPVARDFAQIRPRRRRAAANS